jgi:hypothetical protein
VKCVTKTCDAPAVARAFWPGQGAPGYCGPCLRRAVAVAEVMGFDLHVESVAADDERKPEGAE